MTYIYTDASLNTGDSTAASVAIYFGNNNKRNITCIVKHQHMTIQRGEAHAVYIALKILAIKEPAKIYTDSRTVVDYLSNTYEIPKQYKENNIFDNVSAIMDKIKKCRNIIQKRKDNHVKTSILYIPGHCGNPGNEAADRMAAQTALNYKLNEAIQETSLCNIVAIDIQDMSPKKKGHQSVLPISNIIFDNEGNNSQSLTNVSPTIDKSNPDIWWKKQSSAMDNTDEVLVDDKNDDKNDDNQTISTGRNHTNKVSIPTTCSLFLCCIKCSETILVEYLSISKLCMDDSIIVRDMHPDDSTLFTITKCRSCILDSISTDEILNVKSVAYDHQYWTQRLEIYSEMIRNCRSHEACSYIVDHWLPILCENDLVKYTPINIITNLCGKECRAVSIDVMNKCKFEFLRLGFL